MTNFTKNVCIYIFYFLLTKLLVQLNFLTRNFGSAGVFPPVEQHHSISNHHTPSNLWLARLSIHTVHLRSLSVFIDVLSLSIYGELNPLILIYFNYTSTYLIISLSAKINNIYNNGICWSKYFGIVFVKKILTPINS